MPFYHGLLGQLPLAFVPSYFGLIGGGGLMGMMLVGDPAESSGVLMALAMVVGLAVAFVLTFGPLMVLRWRAGNPLGALITLRLKERMAQQKVSALNGFFAALLLGYLLLSAGVVLVALPRAKDPSWLLQFAAGFFGVAALCCLLNYLYLRWRIHRESRPAGS